MEPEKYNCLIIDDEPIARKIITNYLEQMPFPLNPIERINAFSAIDFLKTNNDVDIIFLDINMPNLTGLELIKIVQPKQPVIFTTAYAEHAVESYDFNAVDYLLKPFSFERFAKAVYKALDVISNSHTNGFETANQNRNDLLIKSEGKTYPVLIDDILYCEARKNYTMVVLKTEQKLMPLVPLSRFETMLSEAGGEFIQIHRSFLVSKKYITAISPNNVTVNKFEIPLGTQFKEKVFKTYLSQPPQQPKKLRARILLKKGTDFHFCKIEDVAYFYSEYKLVFLVDFQQQKHLTDFKTLSVLEEELDSAIFYRANRRFIININAIKKFKTFDRVKLKVELSTKVPEDVVISQENATDFKNWVASKHELDV